MSNHEVCPDAGSILRHRPLTYRIVKEICNAARELARFPAPFFSVLPDLFVAGDDTREIHSLAPGVATNAGRCGEGAWSDRGEGPQRSAPSAPRLLVDDASLDGDQS